MTIECLEEIRLLSNLETDQSKLIQILLIGQPELKETLSQHALRQLRQRISIMYEIEPLDRMEVTAYIDARIEVAGERKRSPLRRRRSIGFMLSAMGFRG